jgi:hypothetical protein
MKKRSAGLVIARTFGGYPRNKDLEEDPDDLGGVVAVFLSLCN